ncbi:MAG TPA: beta-ketoacyl-[acyl-carrier-protein] synthase family protein [Pyrinomonadaceae bacterium]|nr:beta-ketoacyl-[acyl-carrier-protein] synthase family protein [Pyrinomonadaceae bacterium]
MGNNFGRRLMNRRVAITGIGVMSPIGQCRDCFWESLRSGKSGVGRITSFDTSSFSVQIAAQVGNFDWPLQIPTKDQKNVPRTVPLLLRATAEALADARIDTVEMSLEERRAIGVEIGTGGGGFAFTEEHYKYWYVGPKNKASVYIIPASTHGGLSSEVSMAFGLRGLSHVVSTGCTSSTDAIFYAAEHIRRGRQDVMIAGGVDAPIAPGILAGFELMKVLTTQWNDEPWRASRPFSGDRSGMVLGEGAYVFVLEDLERALDRGAKIFAEITGYGSTCDAYHRVRLNDSGEEPARAMSIALEDADGRPEEIDYVNLHGTSTVLNDRIETSAIKQAFGSHAYNIPMSATKSQVGHPQGASGAAGLMATLFAMDTGTIPATINLETPDPECDLDYVPNVPREHDINTALCNCIGFGSKNSALVLRRFAEDV